MPTHVDAYTIATDNRASAADRNGDAASTSTTNNTASHPNGLGSG